MCEILEADLAFAETLARAGTTSAGAHMTHDGAEAGEAAAAAAECGRLAGRARSHAQRDSSERPGSPPRGEEIRRSICWKLAMGSRRRGGGGGAGCLEIRSE